MLAPQISEGKFSALGALGAGLLTGTALAVILPEGFHAFQAAQDATGLQQQLPRGPELQAIPHSLQQGQGCCQPLHLPLSNMRHCLVDRIVL